MYSKLLKRLILNLYNSILGRPLNISNEMIRKTNICKESLILVNWGCVLMCVVNFFDMVLFHKSSKSNQSSNFFDFFSFLVINLQAKLSGKLLLALTRS